LTEPGSLPSDEGLLGRPPGRPFRFSGDGGVVIVIRRVKVLEHERALLFRNGPLEEVSGGDPKPAIDPALGGG